ncbi:MAG: Hsp33 family molecular chaperone HslO [Planctomycetes bacterium]|nr:Hsp33 family molecular chaperone HslO [Planctomycetota bacterium]
MSDPEDGANRVELVSHFVRHKNAMVARGDFGPLFEDHYLHLMQSGQPRLNPAQDTQLKDALAGLVLHLMSNPRDFTTAWTLNFNEPPMNLFVTGDSEEGRVVGRVFTKDVKVHPRPLFYSQTSRPRGKDRQSTVEFAGGDLFSAVEQYYATSEQFPARLFHLEGDKAAMVTAHPDADLEWFAQLTAEKVAQLDESEELGFLERRSYHFACGCRLITIVRVLVNTFGRDPEKVFAGQDTLQISCPRCAGTFELTTTLFAEALILLDGAKADEK